MLTAGHVASLPRRKLRTALDSLQDTRERVSIHGVICGPTEGFMMSYDRTRRMRGR
jgi:hypothetical protein